MSDDEFRARYGPWALVAGASEGVGAAFARAVAERGMNVVLLARRQSVLDEVAASIEAGTGARTRTLVVDLTTEDAMATIAGATADLEIGLMLYGAGADPNYQRFLANPVDTALTLVHRNCVVLVQMCHHFAGPMVERGRGGLVTLSSGAGMAGGPNMVAYAASKAFDTVMMQALWSELRGSGVDVLAMVLGMTDTPALRRLLAQRGALAGEDDPAPIPGAAAAADVAATVIANLAEGPTCFMGDDLSAAAQILGSMSRRDAVEAMASAGGLPGEDTAGATT